MHRVCANGPIFHPTKEGKEKRKEKKAPGGEEHREGNPKTSPAAP
jgi:hypothetical protein